MRHLRARVKNNNKKQQENPQQFAVGVKSYINDTKRYSKVLKGTLTSNRVVNGFLRFLYA